MKTQYLASFTFENEEKNPNFELDVLLHQDNPFKIYRDLDTVSISV